MKVTKFDDFFEIQNISFELGNCYISNLAIVSRYLGIDLKECEICTSYGHSYCYGNWEHCDKNIHYPTLISLDPDVESKKIIKTMEDFGIELKQIVYSTQSEVFEFINDNINKNLPVLVNVDAYYLKHWPSNIRDHYAHYIIVYGISDDMKNISIVDSYIPDVPPLSFKGDIDINDFIKALNFKDIRVNHEKKIVWSLKPNGNVLINTHKIFENYLKNTLNNLYEQTDEREVTIGSFRYVFNTGIRALTYFNDALKSQILSNVDIIELYKNITSFGGPIKNLSIIRKYFEDKEQLEMINIIQQNLNLWNSLGLNMLRYNVVDDIKYLKESILILEQIISMEKLNMFEGIKLICQK